MTKTKRTLSEEQKAKMAEGRKKALEAKAAAKKEEDFVPTEVQQHQAAENAKKEYEGLREPEIKDKIEDVPKNANVPTAAPQPQVQVDPNLVATIAVAVAEAMRQNPQVATAPPDQKLQELESMGNKQHTARLGAGGEVQGVVFRYPVDKNYYPDPTNKLLDEPKLARFALRQNYIFRWSVDGVEYKKNNITYTEPRFTLELFRKLYNEDNEPTGKMALVARQMLHEDEFTTRIMAMRMGILENFEDTEEGFRALMSQIRYERFREWLLNIFSPAKIQTYRKRPVQQVIDGKVVEVYDTEELTDHDTATAQASSLQTQTGVGTVSVPGE